MALTDNGNGLSAADVAAVVGNNGGMFGNGLFGGNVVNAGFTGIHNELCQDRLEAKDLRIRELENQLNVAAFNTSQVAQTAQLEAFIRANQTTPATTAG